MDDYKLIGLDDMEATKLRRKLDPWDPAKGERVKSLIERLFLQSRSSLKVKEPRWEANVYPLYYYYPEAREGKGQRVYERVLEDYEYHFPKIDPILRDKVKTYIGRIANAEIDLLIEDKDYFLFIEAKDPRPGEKARFSGGEAHQLVCQFVQGKILEHLIRKPFMMATLGAGAIDLSRLNDTSKALLAAVGVSQADFELCDFDWTILD